MDSMLPAGVLGVRVCAGGPNVWLSLSSGSFAASQ